MAQKKINTRITNKHDIEANWNKASNFIPLPGELIIYDIDDTHDYVRFKVGDGKTDVISLPFTYSADDAADNASELTSFNVKNGTGNGSVAQKEFTYTGDSIVFSDGTKGAQSEDIIPGAVALGEGSIALGGVKYDYYTSPETHAANLLIDPTSTENWGRTPTSAEGRQSFAGGGSSHAYGDWSLAFGKDAKAYQGGSISLGGSCTAGLSEIDIVSYYGVEAPDSEDSSAKIVVSKYLYTNGILYEFAYLDPANGYVYYPVYNRLQDGSDSIGFEKSEILRLGLQDEAGGPIKYMGNRFCFSANTSRSIGYGSASFNSGKSIGRTSFAANTATVEGSYSAGFGQNNIITVTAPNAFVAGAVNTVQFDKSSALGWNLKTTRESQTVLGRYNKYTENTDDLLQVGGGINNDIRYNFFGVRGDGRGYLYKGPEEDNDIVRLQELNQVKQELADRITDSKADISTKLDKFNKTSDGMYWIYAHHPNPAATGAWNRLLAPLVGDVAAHNKAIVSSSNDSVPLYYRAKKSDGTFEGFALICDTPENLSAVLKPKSVVNRGFIQPYLDYLDEQMYKAPAITLNLSPTRVAYGSSANVSLTYSVSNQNNVASNEPREFFRNQNAQGSWDLAGGTLGPFAESDITSDITYKLEGKNTRGEWFSATKKLSVYYPCYIGSSANNTYSSSNFNLIKEYLQDTFGTQTFEAPGSAYIYFRVHGTITKITDPISGFGVPFVDLGTTSFLLNSKSVTYHVYRTAEKLNAGSWTFKFN